MYGLSCHTSAHLLGNICVLRDGNRDSLERLSYIESLHRERLYRKNVSLAIPEVWQERLFFFWRDSHI